MGSNDRDVQLAQVETAERELAMRLATLTERGMTTPSTDRDRAVRHLRADIVSLKKRVTTIDDIEKRRQVQAKRKAAKAAEALKPKKKKKKVEEVKGKAKGKKKPKAKAKVQK